MHDTPDEAAADLRSLLDPKKLGDGKVVQGLGLRVISGGPAARPSLLRFVDWTSTDDRKR